MAFEFVVMDDAIIIISSGDEDDAIKKEKGRDNTEKMSRYFFHLCMHLFNCWFGWLV